MPKRPTDYEKTIRVQIHLDKDTDAALSVLAERMHASRSWVLRRLIRDETEALGLDQPPKEATE